MGAAAAVAAPKVLVVVQVFAEDAEDGKQCIVAANKIFTRAE
jgi:hypothetical protein